MVQFPPEFIHSLLVAHKLCMCQMGGRAGRELVRPIPPTIEARSIIRPELVELFEDSSINDEDDHDASDFGRSKTKFKIQNKE